MAKDVNHQADAVAPPLPAAVHREQVPGAAARLRPAGGYRGRFRLAYAALALLAAAGLAGFGLLLARDAPPEAAPWSAWKPEGSALARMRQIADRIPQAYLLPSNDRLNIAIARGLVAQVDEKAIPIGAILLEPDAATGGAEEDDVVVYDAEDTVGVALCGLGPSCSLPGGETSDAAFAVRRQAVELALYGFRYVDGLAGIVVFMPPTAKGESGGAIYLRREDVEDELRVPLAQTLPQRPNQIVGETTPDELATVVRLTDSRLYNFAYEAAPDGNPVMVLSPPGVSG